MTERTSGIEGGDEQSMEQATRFGRWIERFQFDEDGSDGGERARRIDGERFFCLGAIRVVGARDAVEEEMIVETARRETGGDRAVGVVGGAGLGRPTAVGTEVDFFYRLGFAQRPLAHFPLKSVHEDFRVAIGASGTIEATQVIFQPVPIFRQVGEERERRAQFGFGGRVNFQREDEARDGVKVGDDDALPEEERFDGDARRLAERVKDEIAGPGVALKVTQGDAFCERRQKPREQSVWLRQVAW